MAGFTPPQAYTTRPGTEFQGPFQNAARTATVPCMRTVAVVFFGGAGTTLHKLLCYCQCGAVAGGVPELEEFVVHSGYYHLEAAHFLYREELADEGAG